jgi:hypothetical protein
MRKGFLRTFSHKNNLMLLTIPMFVAIIFVATVLLTLLLFVRSATKNKNLVLYTCVGWLALQGVIADKGFYLDTSTMPPRFALAIVPALLAIILLFATKGGRRFIDHIDLRAVTLVSIVRIPVEVVLYWLFVNKAVPQLMTFTGRNFDIISGITAPVAYFVCFKRSNVSNKNLLLLWNVVSLGLLLNIVVNAVLSAPFPFQQFAFDQPNIAIFYFPFVWLPSFIVMVVLFSHLVSLRRLIKNKNLRPAF